jgi:tetraacyldisaccharide 4'-kinase
MSNPLIRVLLSPFSALFWMAVFVRNFCYDRHWFNTHKLEGTVISVGNIAVGGTGKSPLVISICRHLCQQGLRPAILTRGYRSGLDQSDSTVLLGKKVILPPTTSGKVFADEARMQSVELGNVPVVVGADRYGAYKRYTNQVQGDKPTHWILDDGFQHRKIQRDIDIVLLDAADPFCGGVLPSGRLREPTGALGRANKIVFTRAGEGLPTARDRDFVTQRFRSEVFELNYRADTLKDPVGDLVFDPTIHGPVLFVSAIAHGKRALNNLNEIKIDVADSHIIEDHGRLEKDELKKKLSKCRSIVTTAKDYWRDSSVFEGLEHAVFVLSLEILADDFLLDQLCDLRK